MTSYIDQRYDETFESVHDNLKEVVDKNPEGAEYIIRGLLKSLYIRQGNDWTGRGAIGNAGLDATIAAHESLLVELTSR
jgi:hypothetical protein